MEQGKGRSWEKTNKALRKRDKPEASVSQGLGAPKKPVLGTDRLEKPIGVIAKWKSNSIERNAALEYISDWHAAELGVVKNQLCEAVRVKDAETRLVASEYLAALDSRHIHYMGELGLENVGQKMELLTRLQAQTADVLAKLEKDDAPPVLADASISDVIELHREFAASIMEGLKGKKDV